MFVFEEDLCVWVKRRRRRGGGGRGRGGGGGGGGWLVSENRVEFWRSKILK